jgi:cytochrome b involved in lipid metabolism
MSSKIVTLEELRQHASKEELWLLINGKGLSHSTSSDIQSV